MQIEDRAVLTDILDFAARVVDDADDRLRIAARCYDCGVLGTVDSFDWTFEPINE